MDALAGDERAVARPPVVDERPLGAQSLERHVHARDLGVPLQHDAGGTAAPDRQPFRRPVEIDDALRVLAVAVEQERAAETFGREARLEFGGGGAMHPVHPRGGGPSLSSSAGPMSVISRGAGRSAPSGRRRARCAP